VAPGVHTNAAEAPPVSVVPPVVEALVVESRVAPVEPPAPPVVVDVVDAVDVTTVPVVDVTVAEV